MAYIRPLSQPYTTRILKPVSKSIDNIRYSIQKYFREDSEDFVIDPHNSHIRYLRDLDLDIDNFLHPLPLSTDKDVYIFVDARNFMNKKGIVNSPFELKFMRSRAILDYKWLYDHKKFHNMAGLVADIFSKWFSTRLGSRYGIEGPDRILLQMISFVYYIGLIYNDDIDLKSDLAVERQYREIIQLIQRNTYLNLPAIDSALGTYRNEIVALYSNRVPDGDYSKLDELIEVIDLFIHSHNAITIDVLFNTLLSGSYVGFNSSEVTGIALEHPPIFYLLTYHGFIKSIQGKGVIGRMVAQQASVHKNAMTFVNHMKSMIDEYNNIKFLTLF